MGWLWASAGPPKAPRQPKPDTTPPSQSDAPPPPQSDDGGDPELAKFMADIQAALEPKPSRQRQKQQQHEAAAVPSAPPPSDEPAQQPSQSTQGSGGWFSWRGSASASASTSGAVSASASSTYHNSNDGPQAAPFSTQPPAEPNAPAAVLSPLAESLLPTTMSCRQAFDLAWACQSVSGQFLNVYRYGEARSCSDHWADFWFCMRTRSLRGEAKEHAIRDHYRRREVERYGPGRPSSTDVWQERETRAPEGSLFAARNPWGGGLGGMSDETWRRITLDRKREWQRRVEEERRPGR